MTKHVSSSKLEECTRRHKYCRGLAPAGADFTLYGIKHPPGAPLPKGVLRVSQARGGFRGCRRGFWGAAGGARVARWWAREGEGAPAGQALAGKPSVFFRKTVNARTDDGRCVAVNAQQYAVLVMDVPDLRVERKHRCCPGPHLWLVDSLESSGTASDVHGWYVGKALEWNRP